MKHNWDNYHLDKSYLSKETETEYINIYKELFNSLNIDISTYSILEVGAGFGQHTNILYKISDNLISIEPNKILFDKLINKYKNKNIKLENKNIEEFTTNKKFDAIFFINVFLFMQDKQKILLNLYSLVKQHKYIIIVEPLRFLKFNNQNKSKFSNNNNLMKETIIFINKSNKFKLIYYGIINHMSMCYILKKK